MLKEEFPTWPEVSISDVLKRYKIGPSEKTYSPVYNVEGGGFFLTDEEGRFVKYELQDLEPKKKIKIKNTSVYFQATVVEEDGKKRGAGLYLGVLEGGKGCLFIPTGDVFKNPSVKSLEPVDFLLKL